MNCLSEIAGNDSCARLPTQALLGLRLPLAFPPLREALREWGRAGDIREHLFKVAAEISARWLCLCRSKPALSRGRGNLAPMSALPGSVTALTCSWPLGKCPFALVLLKDRDQWLVCSLSFCHPAQMWLLNREGFAVAVCGCCGESGGRQHPLEMLIAH